MTKLIRLSWVDASRHAEFLTGSTNNSKYRNMEREEVICLVRGHDYLYITADFSKEGEEKIKSVMTTKMLEDLFTMSCSLMGLSADPKDSLTSTPLNKED